MISKQMYDFEKSCYRITRASSCKACWLNKIADTWSVFKRPRPVTVIKP